jgi:hypothetical protein
MIPWQERLSFVPLVKYSYKPSPEELKHAKENFDKIKDFLGQMISSYGMLNVNGTEKIIEVVAVNSNMNYLEEISKLDDLASMFGWKVFITMSQDFGNPLI